MLSHTHTRAEVNFRSQYVVACAYADSTPKLYRFIQIG